MKKFSLLLALLALLFVGCASTPKIDWDNPNELIDVYGMSLEDLINNDYSHYLGTFTVKEFETIGSLEVPYYEYYIGSPLSVRDKLKSSE